MFSKYLLKRHLRQYLSQSSQSQGLKQLFKLQRFSVQTKAVPEQASNNAEDFDTLLRKLQKGSSPEKSQGISSSDNQSKGQVSREPQVVQQKDDVVYISNPNPSWRYLSALNIGEKNASIAISLNKEEAIGLLLKKQAVVGSKVENKTKPNTNIKVKFGQINNSFGEIIKEVDSKHKEEYDIDYSKGLQKTSIKRNLIEKQLFTGNLRLDLGQPLSKGNFIIFRGERQLGKTRVAINTVSQFLQENENNRAIYVGLSKSQAMKAFDFIKPDLKDRFSCFTTGGDDTQISDAEYFLAPKVALQFAQQYLNEQTTEKKNLLFVFDDILLHHFKERHIFDLANQPFAPINIYNELMENTGNFTDRNCSMTSIVIVDSESSSLQFRRDEQTLINHLDSISDQVIEFSSEKNSLTRGLMPIINLKNDNTIIDYWQTPYLRQVKNQLQELIKQINEGHTMHVMRKQLKMDEDPWDNYLVYDAKYFMPLLCHSQELNIEEQILVVNFIKQSIAEENISQYKLKANTLISELMTFTKEFNDEEDEPNLLEKIKVAANQFEIEEEQIEILQQEIERVVKMFYLQMKVKGNLKPLKEDYFV